MNKKFVSIYQETTNPKKVFAVSEQWNDRFVVEKMLEAFYSFAETKNGRAIIVKSYYGVDFHEYMDAISKGEFINPFQIEDGWNILLSFMPDSFFESVGIQILSKDENAQNSEGLPIHMIELTEEEEDAPLDTERTLIVKTIGNYHIIKQFALGTPDEPQSDEAYYQQWYFEVENGKLEEKGYMGYNIEIVDDEQPYEYPDLELYHLFPTVEAAEAFILSVQE